MWQCVSFGFHFLTRQYIGSCEFRVVRSMAAATDPAVFTKLAEDKASETNGLGSSAGNGGTSDMPAVSSGDVVTGGSSDPIPAASNELSTGDAVPAAAGAETMTAATEVAGAAGADGGGAGGGTEGDSRPAGESNPDKNGDSTGGANQAEEETPRGDGGEGTGGGGHTMIGGSIVGDVLYSIATGEEEGRSRARILAFAAKRYQTAVERNPRDYDALYNWALVLQESADNSGPEAGLQGKDALLEEACRKYQAASVLCGTLHEAFYNWAIAISDRAKIRGRTAEAEELWKEACSKYERAVQLNWDSPQALNNWGLALQELSTIVPAKDKRKVVRKAINKFRAAIRLRYDFHRAIYNLGTVLYGLAEDTMKQAKSKTGVMPDRTTHPANEIYSQSAVYIAAAHALKADYPVYRNALRLVRTMLPLPYLKGGYLTVPPGGNSLAPHAEWLRLWFVLDHERLKEGKKPEPKQPHSNLTSRRNTAHSQTSVTASIVQKAEPSPPSAATPATPANPATPGSAAAGSANQRSSDGGQWSSDAVGGRPNLSSSVEDGVSALPPPPIQVEIGQIVSVEACADLSLPAGGGIVLDTVDGPFYMVADDWDSMDAWVDAIRLVYTIYVRGKSEDLAAVLAA
ncbi:unnamed protein product [Closterium sp. Yama58-4]|nr:unnamed protein product [Closterium sp. Yama58-4]